jgi:superfamily II DNA or RNA helicase
MSRRVEVVVDSRLRVGRVPEDVGDALRREFTHKNPARARLESAVAALSKSRSTAQRSKGYALAAQLKREPSAIATWRIDEGELSLPRGGLARARSVLEDRGFELDVIDARTEGDPELRHAARLLVEPWDFQATIVERVLELEQGIVRSPTGSGKTVALAACIAAVGLPTLVVVSTGNLFDQWTRRLQTDLGLRADDVGAIGQGEERVRPVTVGMQQSLAKNGRARRLADRFGFVACDEIHLFAAPTFLDVIDWFAARFRVGVSDDERRKDRKEFLLYDVMGAPIHEVSRKKLVDEGFILDVEVRLVETEASVRWWEELPEQERPTRWTDLLQELGADEGRNALIVRLAAEAAREGEQVLVLAHHEDHCLRLRAGVARQEPRVGLLVARLKKEFSLCLAGLVGRSTRVAVGTYKAVSTALDLPLVSRGVCATPIHNNRSLTQQARGRLCRAPEGKESAAMYVPWDRRLFGLAPLRNWVRWSRTSKVLVRGEWEDGRAVLKREEAAARAEREAGDV